MLSPDKTLAEVGESALLLHLRRRIPEGQGVVLGIGHDAAIVDTSALTIVTTDALVEDVHFRREWHPPRLLGRKALSVNLSDVAAMAGIPRHAVISLCLPPATTFGFVDGLYDGLLERAAETGVNLVGGNVASTAGPAVLSVTLLGQATRVLGRGGARPGDLVVVTGSLGAAAAGLQLLGQGARLDDEGELSATGVWTDSSAGALRHCLRAQLDPEPPLAFARTLSEGDLLHAAIDVSDGLSGDLRRLCEMSGVGAVLDLFALPVDAVAGGFARARGGDALALALHGGEDYELLMAVGPENLAALRDLAVIWDLPLHVIGEFKAGEPEVRLRAGHDTTILTPASHEHFREVPKGSPAG